MSDDGFEQLGKGRFRVDRKRALSKLERFQLEDPTRYVLELVAAAVCAGAARVDIRNDADDFELSFRGAAPTDAELATLWDHLFSRDAQGRDAMLQHLATGVLAAHATKPKWIHVDRGETDELGAVRLVVDDPTETVPEPLDDALLVGTRVHVREQVSPKVLREALMGAFADPAEARLLRGACHRTPIPIRLNGQELPAAASPLVSLLSLPLAPELGQVWLVPPGVAGVVEVVRHGLVMAELREHLGPCGLTGWLRGDDLRLNASRSMVVDDERRQALLERLDEAVDAALCTRLTERMEALDADETLRWSGEQDQAHLRYRATRRELLLEVARSGVKRLQVRGVPVEKWGALREIGLVEDLFGRRWSAAALQQLEQPAGYLTDAALADESLPRAQFDLRHRGLLGALAGGHAEDLTRVCQLRAEGRKRRAQASRRRREPEFGKGPQLRFEDGALRGAVRWDEGRGEDQRGLRIHLRLSGMAVQTLSVHSRAGHLEAIADHPEFRVDHAFLHVSDDETLRRAIDVVTEQAERFVRRHLAEGLVQRPRRWLPALADLIEPGLPKKGFRNLRPVVDTLEPALIDVPALPTAAGGRVSVRQVTAAPVTSPWWLLEQRDAADVPAELAGQVLWVPDGQRKRWRRILKGCTRRGARDSLHASAARARRLNAPRVEAKLPVDGPAQLVVQRDGMQLALAWLPTTLGSRAGSGWGKDAQRQARAMQKALEGTPDEQARIAVLRDGVFIGIAHITLPLRGIAGWVDWPKAPVDDAMSGLTRQGVAKLESVLDKAADELAAAGWRAWGKVSDRRALPPVFGEWLVSRRKQARWVLELLGRDTLVAHWADGRPFLLEDLDRLRRKNVSVTLVSDKPPQLPGLGDVVVARSGAEVAIRGWARRKVEDGDEQVHEMRVRLERYLKRPRHQDRPPALMEEREEHQGLTWTYTVAALPGDIGRQDVEFVWRHRLLVRREGGLTLGCHLRVEGARIQPNAELTSVADTKLLQRAKEQSRVRFARMVKRAIDKHGKDPRHRLSFRALAARVGDRSRPGAKALRSQGVLERLAPLPLFSDLSGAPVSARDLADQEEQGMDVRVVDDALGRGPGDGAPYVLAGPWVAEALAALLGREVEDGSGHLRAWRRGQQRRRGLHRRKAALPPGVLLRAPLTGEHLGEVGLVAGPPGLRIEPLVDGLPLAVVDVPFPVAARAVVQGPSVRADTSFHKVIEDAAFKRLIESLSTALNNLADQACEDWTEQAPASTTTLLRLWALRNRRGGRAREARLFLTLTTPVSLEELDRRQKKDGAVGFVPSARATFPGVQQPLVPHEPAVQELLAARYTLHDLSEVVRQLVTRDGSISLPERPWWLIAHTEVKGALGWGWLGIGPESGGTEGGVALLVNQIVLERITLSFPVEVRGAIEVTDARPDALFKQVANREQVRRLQGWLEEAARGLAPQLAKPKHADACRALLTGLVRGPEDLSDERLTPLVRMPLFVDSTGATGSLETVLADQPVRWVRPGVFGQHHPERSRVWVLAEPSRKLVSRLAKLFAAGKALQEEDLGYRRRTGEPFRKDTPRGSQRFRDLEGDAHGAVWLSAEPGEVTVLVDQRRAGQLSLGSPLLRGWVDGAFETSLSFTDPVVPPSVREQLMDAAEALLADPGTPEVLCVRALEAALKDSGPHVEDLLARQVRPWGAMVVASEPDGELLTLSDLAQTAAQHRRILWVEDDAMVLRPPLEEPVVVSGTRLVERLRQHMGVPWVHVDERVDVEAPIGKVVDDDVLREARRLVERLAGSLAQSDGRRVKRAATHWLGPSGGPPWLVAAVDDDRVATLVAWRLAVRAKEGVAPMQEELDLLEAVLDRLAGG